jgi:hypothetical protein
MARRERGLSTSDGIVLEFVPCGVLLLYSIQQSIVMSLKPLGMLDVLGLSFLAENSLCSCLCFDMFGSVELTCTRVVKTRRKW